MKLLTAAIVLKLQANCKAQTEAHGSADFKPVVKLFSPYSNATWLLTEMDEDERLFGLCDLGMGHPELGYVMLSELEQCKKNGAPLIERDRYFDAKDTKLALSAYAATAKLAGSIRT